MAKRGNEPLELRRTRALYMATNMVHYLRRSMAHEHKESAPRNRTLRLGEDERRRLAGTLLRPPLPTKLDELVGRVVCGDSLALLPALPRGFVDLLLLDPPYNLSKDFGGTSFRRVVDSTRGWKASAVHWYDHPPLPLGTHASVYRADASS
jgi:site-specific DNA-methyltransferase (adenine-specific)